MGCTSSKPNAIESNQVNPKNQILDAPSPIAALEGHIEEPSGLFFKEAVSNASNMLAAVKRGDIEAVKLLLCNENLNIRGMWNSTPLIIACQYGYDEIAITLLDRPGIDVNHLNEKGAGALLFACLEGKLEVVQKLVSLGAECCPPTTSSLYNQQIDKSVPCVPLSAACMNGHQEIVQILIDNCGCDVNCRFPFSLTKNILTEGIACTGLTPLSVACAFGKGSLVSFLLEKNANVFIVDSEKSNCFHHATRAGKLAFDTVMALKTSNAVSTELVNAVDSRGEIALHLACELKRPDIGKVLLELGSNPNARNSVGGTTPLHTAVKKRSIELVNLLLDWGANPLVMDDRGISAADSVGQLRKDSPLLLRMEQAATSWQALRAINSVLPSDASVLIEPGRGLQRNENQVEDLPPNADHINLHKIATGGMCSARMTRSPSNDSQIDLPTKMDCPTTEDDRAVKEKVKVTETAVCAESGLSKGAPEAEQDQQNHPKMEQKQEQLVQPATLTPFVPKRPPLGGRPSGTTGTAPRLRHTKLVVAPDSASSGRATSPGQGQGAGGLLVTGSASRSKFVLSPEVAKKPWELQDLESREEDASAMSLSPATRVERGGIDMPSQFMTPEKSRKMSIGLSSSLSFGGGDMVTPSAISLV